MKQLTQNEFNRTVEMHENWRRGLEGALSEQAHFRNTDLTNINMDDFDLTGAKFEHVVLDEMEVEKTILADCEFKFVSMKGTRLFDCNFNMSHFMFCDGNGMGVVDCEFFLTHHLHSFYSKSSFDSVNFDDSSFAVCSLNSCKQSNCTFKEVDFKNCAAYESHFSEMMSK